MKKVGVILAGCGVYDGSEIHEAVLTLLYLDRAGAEIHCFAPDKDQMHVVNHATGQPAEGEKRNTLVESARIARGEIKPLSQLNLDNLDAIIFPGGFGAAKNLCSFAVDGDRCDIDPEVAAVIQDAAARKKVVGAICISPVVVARALRDSGKKPELTIGTDKATGDALAVLKAKPVSATVSEIVVDKENKIVTTPAYMLGSRITEVAAGIENLVRKVVEMA
ncbi:MAG: isoprenoid biosynthesis glyoxalase ElbB [Candidatus Zixiibacteriota bacterium]|nr:MAG: isoprenoid biosynthesis glyoxalase ElbB [candidate division Zixibacteria bacterium]